MNNPWEWVGKRLDAEFGTDETKTEVLRILGRGGSIIEAFEAWKKADPTDEMFGESYERFNAFLKQISRRDVELGCHPNYHRMIYAVSDIHGCYDKYKALMDKLVLLPGDHLYVLGDVMDRGPDGPKILLDLMKRERVTFIPGNHDETAALILGNVLDENCRIKVPRAEEAVALWLSDGGKHTLEQFFRELTADERKSVLDYIQNAHKYETIIIKGKVHLLAHSIPEIEDFQEQGGMKGLDTMDFSFNETDYDVCYDENVIMVSGHTPTGLIDPAYKGRIWKGNNHIAIDCGTGWGNPLGCICLNTGEEFYV